MTDDRDESDPVLRVERYEIDDGVVFYDAENPLAWVEASRPLCLEDLA